MKTERKIVEGVEWIYHYHDFRVSSKSSYPIPLPRTLYMATYKCQRCSHVWDDSGYIYPLNMQPCLIDGCSKPNLIQMLLRSLKGESFNGLGKLIKVDVEAYKLVKVG